MDQLEKQVARARRRLAWQKFLTSLPACLFVTLLVAAVAIALPKLFTLSIDPSVWNWSWAAGGVAAGVLAALIWTRVRRPESLAAAIEIDRRFGLKERVASSLSLDETEQESPAGQALVKDALRRVEGIEVTDEFRLSAGRRAWLPLIPAALAFALAMFVQDKGLQNQAQANMATAAEKKQVKTSTEVLRRKLAERRKKAGQAGLKDAEEFLKKIEEGTRELDERKDTDRRKALVKLNDLAKDLEQRKKMLGGDDKIKQQLNQLKNLRQGPADKMAKAMRDGDFQKALDELKKLQQQMQDGKMDADAQQALADQMKQMEEKLRDAVQAQRQAQQDLQNQIDQARQAGDMAQANRLQQQLDKLAARAPQLQKLDQLAQKMGEASKQMQQGDMQQAAEALEQIAQDMQAMKQAMEELEMLDDALDQLAQAKDAMGCRQCGGAGCKACGGAGQQGQQPGNGLGAGQGQGDRPEEKDDVKAYDSRVRQNVGKGKAVITDLVDGPNVKGRVLEDIKNQIDSARAEEADPLSDQRLPKKQAAHAREYFDAFREGGVKGEE